MMAILRWQPADLQRWPFALHPAVLIGRWPSICRLTLPSSNRRDNTWARAEPALRGVRDEMLPEVHAPKFSRAQRNQNTWRPMGNLLQPLTRSGLRDHPHWPAASPQ